MKTIMYVSLFAVVLMSLDHANGAGYQPSEGLTSEDQVRIFVPAFTGTDSLGKNVSNVLRLQISQTFRESDGKGNNFGRGVLLWADKPLKELSHEAAFRRALDIGTLAHLVLWGTAVHYGDGVVVQSYLTVTPLVNDREKRPEVVRLSRDTPSGTRTLSLDMPTLHYNFRPTVLRKDIIDRYQTISNVPIYSDRDFKKVVGAIGEEFRAFKYQEDAVYLRSGSVKGWVQLPQLTESRSEIVAFASAIIRILRGDWLGARDMLEEAVSSDNVPQAIAIDAAIYNGISEEKQGKSGLRYFHSAFDLNRFNKMSAQYVIFGLMSEKDRLAKLGKSTDKIAGDLSKFMQEIRYLMPDDDPWMKDARAMSVSH